MARRPNYGFEKRQKEMERQKKKDAKAERKEARKNETQEGGEGAGGEGAGSEGGSEEEEGEEASVPATLGAGEPDAALRARLEELIDEGWEIWQRFDTEVRHNHWHPFVAADYDSVLKTLTALRRPGLRFLEWGSATGVITIMADLLGYEAYGIELDPELVDIARGLADRFGSRARFAAGSFLPTGYQWRPQGGDGRTGTIGQGTSGYAELQHPLEDFDLVYGFPWDGEAPMMHDLMRCYGGRGARLLLHGGRQGGVQVYRDGRPES